MMLKHKKNAAGKPDKAKIPPWPKALKAYVLTQLAACVPYHEIYKTVTTPDFEKRTGIKSLDPEIFSYQNFRARALHIPRDKVQAAHEEWKSRFDDVRWAEEKARVQGLSDLIDKLLQSIENGELDTGLVTETRLLMEQIRKERNTDADRAALAASGTRVLIANPKNVEINLPLLDELILTYRHEIGGLHMLDLSALTVRELEQLSEKCQTIITERITTTTIETKYTEEEGDDD